MDILTTRDELQTKFFNRLTAYTLRAYALALGDIAPYGHNVVYAGTVIPFISSAISIFKSAREIPLTPFIKGG